ncbi:MAG: universal stress protein [Terriglobia bacterium]|jgi:nucleotide-binding universal stress UspA family protein
MGKPKVMVAVREGVSVESLVTLACQLSQGMDAELTALHVVEVPLATPLDAEEEALDHVGKEVLAQAKRVAKKFSRHLSTELLRAREAGEAIVGVAKEKAVDLLVMGHHKPHSHTLADTLLGGIVRYVAHHAPCRVIVQIPAPESK